MGVEVWKKVLVIMLVTAIFCNTIEFPVSANEEDRKSVV